MGTLTLYEITSDELRQLELGDPSSTYFNIGCSSISLAVGIGTTLLAGGEVASRVAFDVLVILTVIGMLAGFVLLVLWRRQAKHTGSVSKIVRERSHKQFQSVASLTVTQTSTTEQNQ